MPKIKFVEVLSYSSQDPNHPADNLLRSDTFRKWKCAPNTSEKQSFVILKFDKLTSLNSLDIGNDGSALVEVLVSREGMSDYELLLVSSVFMSPAESRNETDLNRVRMFGPEKLNKNVAEQKWDRLKVICTQPFNTRMQYGLAFIAARSPENEKQESSQKVTHIGNFKLKAETDCDPISVGSMFAKRNEKAPLLLTEPAAIKAASRELVAAAPGRTMKRKDLPSDESSSPLIKKRTTESIREPLSKDSPSTSHTTNKNKKKKTEISSKVDSKHKRTEEKAKLKDTENREEREEKKRRNRNEENSNSKPSSSKADQQETTKKRKSKPFNSLMDDVVFVMSGYQNPERSTLRDKLTEMGAQYKPDWNPQCTHLICAFTNTPKYRQVKGKGTIVTGKWIQDCHKNKMRYPWRRYGLEKNRNDFESEEEIWAEELLPKFSNPNLKPATPPKPTEDSDMEEDFNYSDDTDTDDEIQKILGKQQTNMCHVSSGGKESVSSNNENNSGEPSSERDKTLIPKLPEKDKEKIQYKKESPNSENNMNSLTLNGFQYSSDEEIYNNDTDVDELPDTSSLPYPDLEDYFGGLCFFLYGNMTKEVKKRLTRYIIAYNGEIEDYMSEEVNIVLTDERWDENFEEALKDNSALEFVKTQWIFECCDEEKLVPRGPFLLVPEK